MSKLIHDFYTLCTGNICDVTKPNIINMDPGIKPLHFSMKVVGLAYTVECTGGNNLAIHHAIASAPTDSVLVINVHGYMGSGHVGDIMSTACQVRGIKGIVIDGTCRDVDDIIKMNFPVFARGTNPHSNAKKDKGVLNQVIECGGIKVSPGDVILGDATGVVAFPQKQAQEIFDKATALAIKEMGIVQLLHEGKTTLEIYGLDKMK